MTSKAATYQRRRIKHGKTIKVSMFDEYEAKMVMTTSPIEVSCTRQCTIYN